MCAGACVCAHVHVLRIVSVDKILHFTNTLIIINHILPVIAVPHGGPMENVMKEVGLRAQRRTLFRNMLTVVQGTHFSRCLFFTAVISLSPSLAQLSLKPACTKLLVSCVQMLRCSLEGASCRLADCGGHCKGTQKIRWERQFLRPTPCYTSERPEKLPR